MFSLLFFTVGTLPKGAFSEIALEYHKRLGAYVRLEHRPYKDAESLENHVPHGSRLIILEADGKLRTSEAFAEMVRGWDAHGESIVVALGGPFGFSEAFKARADVLLSLSPMTMPHDLAHLVFLEQLYRAGTIIHGKKYHY
jgi:23S rRNA (pseudouridine1915-N3)-methyltransferase